LKTVWTAAEKPLISGTAVFERRFPQAFNTPAVDNAGKFN